jgi:hypothetical protein
MMKSEVARLKPQRWRALRMLTAAAMVGDEAKKAERETTTNKLKKESNELAMQEKSFIGTQVILALVHFPRAS